MKHDETTERAIREAIAAEGARHARYRDVLLRGAKASLLLLTEARSALEQVQRRAFMPPDTRIAVENALGRVTATEHEFGILLAGLETEWVKPTPAPRSERPEIVCLCGSTRFADEFVRQNLRLTLEGKIVLSIGAVVSDSSLGINQESDAKVRLDELHLRKIDLADRVLVLNVDGYVGDSTRREVAYAQSVGRPVSFLEAPDPAGAGR